MIYPEPWARHVWETKKKFCTRAEHLLKVVHAEARHYNISLTFSDVENLLIYSLQNDRANNSRGKLWRHFRALTKAPSDTSIQAIELSRCVLCILEEVDVYLRQRQLWGD